jgi:hypothetical protein
LCYTLLQLAEVNTYRRVLIGKDAAPSARSESLGPRAGVRHRYVASAGAIAPLYRDLACYQYGHRVDLDPPGKRTHGAWTRLADRRRLAETVHAADDTPTSALGRVQELWGSDPTRWLTFGTILAMSQRILAEVGRPIDPAGREPA